MYDSHIQTYYNFLIYSYWKDDMQGYGYSVCSFKIYSRRMGDP